MACKMLMNSRQDLCEESASVASKVAPCALRIDNFSGAYFMKN